MQYVEHELTGAFSAASLTEALHTIPESERADTTGYRFTVSPANRALLHQELTSANTEAAERAVTPYSPDMSITYEGLLVESSEDVDDGLVVIEEIG